MGPGEGSQTGFCRVWQGRELTEMKCGAGEKGEGLKAGSNQTLEVQSDHLIQSSSLIGPLYSIVSDSLCTSVTLFSLKNCSLCQALLCVCVSFGALLPMANT